MMREGAVRTGPRLLRVRSLIRTSALLLVLAVLAAGLVRGFVIQSFGIPSGSMEPTLHAGDRVTIWRPDGLRGHVQRGDIVVIDGRGSFIAAAPPDGLQRVGFWFGLGPRDVFYVKRVIAVGGDTLECCDDDGRLLLNGAPLDEPYLAGPGRASDSDFAVEVPAGRLWLMGDSRGDSTDSRDLLGRPGGGMIPISRVLGTVIGHGSSVDRTAG